jgi:tetratricopeptide (TPR) repeat protein
MKSRLRNLLMIILIYSGCLPTPPSWASDSPSELIEKADSLLAIRPNDLKLKDAIIKANIKLAKNNNNSIYYKKILEIDPKNKRANYYIYLQEGQLHHKKGHKNGQWDAIQSFSKAASVIDTLGEPYYWLGLAYEKKDEMDFELPLESYDKALTLFMNKDIKTKVVLTRAELLERKKTYDDFWK